MDPRERTRPSRLRLVVFLLMVQGLSALAGGSALVSDPRIR